MKVLVVFYSRTGTTKKVAETISDTLKCDTEEILDTKNRAGVLGYFKSGKDAVLKKLTPIKMSEKNAALYDIVIIGTPIWTFTMSAPVRTYLSQNKAYFKRVAFFCTAGGIGSRRAFTDMEKLCGKRPLGVLECKVKDVIERKYIHKVKKFIGEIKNNLL